MREADIRTWLNELYESGRQKAVQSGFVKVPGARLYYERSGEGEPIILLHGGLLDGRMWDDQFQFLAERYQVIRFDARCSGKSEDVPSTEPYSPYRDVYQLIQTLAFPKVSLIGHSGGVRAALDLAIAYPELVRNLIVVSPGISGCEFVDEWILQRNGAFAEAIAQGDLQRAIEVAMTLWTVGPSRLPEQVSLSVRERMREMATHSLSQGILLLMQQIRELEPPAAVRLAEIQVPTLIVLGEKDASDIHRFGKFLYEQVAGAELVMIPVAAHPLTMEKPQAFNTLVEHFLQRHLMAVDPNIILAKIP